jgi:prolyl oligopeptidase
MANTHVDNYHGVEVADPYRWLEQLDSAEVKAWVAEQHARTEAYFVAIPEREAIRRRLTELWDYERRGVPFTRGGRRFFLKNDGLQNQAVLFVQDAAGAEPRVLLDPNGLSEDGTVALSMIEVSEDGHLLAYGISRAGSDWQEWRVRDVATGADLVDELRWIKFSGAAWLPDGSGFFYGRYPEPVAGEAFEGQNFNQSLWFHRLGAPQSEDILVYERPDHKDWMFGAGVTHDGRYLLITVAEGATPHTQMFVKDLPADGPVVEVITGFDAQYAPIEAEGTLLWLRTDRDAPRGRVIAVDLANSDRDAWRTVISESEDTLEGVALIGGRFIAVYLHDAAGRVRVFGKDGTPAGEVALPGIGSVGGFDGRPGDTETFYSFTGYTTPARIYRYDVTTGESTLVWQPAVAFDPDDYETRQVFVTSKDGTRVPVFLTYRRGLDRPRPVYLYGYGGFNISLTPAFSVAALVWMEMGGVYAVANLRGGGEYGEAWHQAGTRTRKQNVFDDFIACAEWLVAEGWTTRDQLAIGGGSNGGLLVGACITQRPELFGAAIAEVGVFDMLRFHTWTIGWAWVADYGSADDPEEFRALYAYSPLHNIRPGTRYPPLLLMTADTDDRVVPAHSFKFAAAMQAAQAGPAPVLLRVELKAGHGAGTPTTKLIEEAADRWAFLVRVLGVRSAPSG